MDWQMSTESFSSQIILHFILAYPNNFSPILFPLRTFSLPLFLRPRQSPPEHFSSVKKNGVIWC